MSSESNPIYRITYEAFSKFSNSLNRCRAFDEIEECFTVNLKYLFNYHVFRASYFRNATYVHLDSTLGNTCIHVAGKPGYLEYEKLLLQSNVPKKWDDLGQLELPLSFTNIADEQTELWGWNFVDEDRRIVVSLLSGNRKKFSLRDINFLKLVADNLETKLLELCLIKELDEKNNIISRIIEDQKEVIKNRTLEIENKNKTLLEISVLNAHNVREPLSRIIGLVNLLDDDEEEELVKQVIPLIRISSNDLDVALKNVINYTTKDLSDLKA
ncbi:MAG: hypothetical protein JWQ40_2374 [Segetibacter sp.]|nr:hypothetical protein [Segetibacter sp.]